MMKKLSASLVVLAIAAPLCAEVDFGDPQADSFSREFSAAAFPSQSPAAPLEENSGPYDKLSDTDYPWINAPDISTNPNDKNQSKANRPPAFMNMNKHLGKPTIDETINYTHEVLATANSKKPSSRFKEAKRALSRSTIHFPLEGSDFNYCIDNPRTLAFVYVGEPNIYLCANLLDNTARLGGTMNAMAQTLIHESVHVMGYSNECTATSVEIQAMRLAVGKLAYENCYMERCGFN